MNTLLIVLTSLCAEGTPILVLQLCQYWQKQGIRLHIVTLSPTPNDLAPEFTALGIPILTLDLGNGYQRYSNLTWQTYKLCREIKPDAVLSMPLGWHAFIAWGSKLAGVKRVCAHVGNLPPTWTGSAFLKFKALVQLGRPVTDRLVCCSDYIRDATMRDFGVSASETLTVYNACDLDRFTTVKRPLFPNQPFRVGMVARLETHKDQPTLIRAAAILRDRGIPIEVRLIGEGSRREELEALIRSLGIEDSVFLLGMKRDIPEQLSQLDLFVFSAKPDEGFGIALAEAMAAGVPIVATDVGACREVLLDGQCGLLVRPGDPVALAGGIHEVINNPNLAAQRVNAAQNRACESFSVKAMANAYEKELGFL